MTNGLLSQIANPVMADVPGAILAGRRGVQQLQAGRLGQQAARGQLELQQQQLTQGRKLEEAQLMGDVAKDLMAAITIGGPNQLAILQRAKEKIPQDSALTPAIDDLLNTPQGKEMDTKILMALDFARQAGFLPKGEKAKRPKFIERIGEQAIVQDTEGGFKTVDIEGLQQLPTPISSEDKQKRVATLRKSVDAFNKEFRDIRAAKNRIDSVGKKGTAASDLALIFNFMKMQDPNSVVRESEFKTAAEARAWLSRAESGGFRIPAFVVQGIQKIETGAFLLPEQREDFITTANNLFTGAQKTADNNISLILERADEDGVSRQSILGKTALSTFRKRKQEAVIPGPITPAQVLKFDAQGNPL